MMRKFCAGTWVVAVSMVAWNAVAALPEVKPAPTTQPADAAKSDPKRPRVVMETSLGRIVIELDAEKAPNTTKNFLDYVESKFYDGTIFHRVVPGFMIQGGGFVNMTSQKMDGLRSPIQNESKIGLKNVRGTIAMARTGEPHSATSQFFINVVDNKRLDYPSFDGWGYCAFGKVVEGMDVVDKIVATPRQPPRQPGEEFSKPVDPPVIKSVRRM